MAGVDLGYDTDGLRQGGREALGAGQVASGAAGDPARRHLPGDGARGGGGRRGAGRRAGAIPGRARRARRAGAHRPRRPRRPGRSRGGCRGRADGLVGGGRPDGGTAMTAPAGVVDLSLPDYATLVARAGMNPDAEAARVASAAPADVRGAGTAFGRAGGELDSAFTASMGAQGSIGAAFTNGGAPVLDRGTHVANLPPGFGDAGTRLARDLGPADRRRRGSGRHQRETSTAVTGLHGELQQTRSSWAARVAAAGTPEVQGRLIPQEAIPGLLAERDRIAAGWRPGRCGGPRGRRPDRHLRDRDQRRRAPARRPRVRAACRAGRRATACPGRRVRGRRGPDRVRRPAPGRLRRGPGEHRAGQLRRGRDRPAVRRPARRPDLRAHLQLPVGPGGAVRSGLVVVGVDPPGGGHLDRGVRGSRRAAGRVPAHGTGFGRAVGIDALVERAGSGWGWPGSTGGAGSSTPRVGRSALGRPGHRGPLGHDDDGRLVELVHERGRRLASRGRATASWRWPARTGGASPTATTQGRWSRRTDRRARAATGSTPPAVAR